MSDEQLAIWRAAYAAAYVADIYHRLRVNGDWDAASTTASVERAMDAADYAVKELGEWRKNEEPSRGIALNDPREGLS